MKNDRPKILKFTSAKLAVTGMLFALGLSACTSSTPTASTKPIAPATGDTTAAANLGVGAPARQSIENKNPNISLSNLTGVDSQIVFSTDIGSMWTDQRITVTAIAPASVGASNGEQTISIPITGGNLAYDPTKQKATGTIDNSGGFSLVQSGKPTLIITDLNINLSTRLITATINGQRNVPLFSVNGTPAVSLDGSEATVRGIMVMLSPKVDSQIQNYFTAVRSLGALTVTTSAAT